MVALNIISRRYAASSRMHLDRSPLPNDQATRLFIAAQQHLNECTQRLPLEICQIIEEYSDKNELKALFRLLTTPKDRIAVIGFESYQEMHKILPLRVSKVDYLKALTRKTGPGFVFDATETSVVEIHPLIDQFVLAYLDNQDWNGTHKDQHNYSNALNWNVFHVFSHLHTVSFNGLNLQISMDDLAKLPPSLRRLDIGGNVWTQASGDIDLNQMPIGLESFRATGCLGINGSLKLFAPRSNLRTVALMNNDLYDVEIRDWEIAPKLKQLFLELNTRLVVDVAQKYVLQACYGIKMFL